MENSRNNDHGRDAMKTTLFSAIVTFALIVLASWRFTGGFGGCSAIFAFLCALVIADIVKRFTLR